MLTILTMLSVNYVTEMCRHRNDVRHVGKEANGFFRPLLNGWQKFQVENSDFRLNTLHEGRLVKFQALYKNKYIGSGDVLIKDIVSGKNHARLYGWEKIDRRIRMLENSLAHDEDGFLAIDAEILRLASMYIEYIGYRHYQSYLKKITYVTVEILAAAEDGFKKIVATDANTSSGGLSVHKPNVNNEVRTEYVHVNKTQIDSDVYTQVEAHYQTYHTKEGTIKKLVAPYMRKVVWKGGKR